MTVSTRSLVIIPTYNEAENIEAIVGRVLSESDSDVLVVDDNSPDGTGRIADELDRSHSRVAVLHRPEKNGLGGAYLEGFGWGLGRGYDVLVEMDADGSHPPEKLRELVAAASAEPVTVAIGSRWVRGGRVVDWPKRRELLSRGANAYARIALGLGVRDVTAGFRAYPARALRRMRLDGVDSRGYCFQIDLTLRAAAAGIALVEIPITFRDRRYGSSKMSGGIIVEAMAKVTAWAFTRRAPRRLAPNGSAG